MKLGPGQTYCPRCDGEGGWKIIPDKPSRRRYDEKHGEEYRENWQDCPDCHGQGIIDEEEEAHE